MSKPTPFEYDTYYHIYNRGNNRENIFFEEKNFAYFNGLVIYIHRNPQHRGFVEDFRTWPYSSYHALLSDKSTHLKRKEVLRWFGGVENVSAAHQQAVEDLQLAMLAPEDMK